MAAALDLPRLRCIAAIGGGGKTSTLDDLAREAAAMGRCTVATTTTRIYVPASGPVRVSHRPEALQHLVLDTVSRSGTVVAGTRIAADGKLHGVSQSWVCDLVSALPGGLTLVEADGSAGRPLKSHGPGEPVVPLCADLVLIVVGLWAAGQTANAKTVHRLETLQARADIRPGAEIDAAGIARLVSSYRRFIPSGARAVLVLNGFEPAVDRLTAVEVAREVRERWPAARVLGARRGIVLEELARGL